METKWHTILTNGVHISTSATDSDVSSHLWVAFMGKLMHVHKTCKMPNFMAEYHE